MPNKGQTISQSLYEKQVKYQKVLKETFLRGEISRDEAIAELKTMGFSQNMCVIKLNEWSSNASELAPESNAENRKRLKDFASLKKYFNKKKK